jgi:hypothetical protein
MTINLNDDDDEQSWLAHCYENDPLTLAIHAAKPGITDDEHVSWICALAVEFGHYDKALKAVVLDGWYWDPEEPQPVFKVVAGLH